MSSFSYALTETTAPGAEPLTLDEVKLHLRIDQDDENTALQGLISTVRAACESFTGRALITRNYSLYMDQWPVRGRSEWWDGMRAGANISGTHAAISLPHPPLSAVTQINIYAGDDSAAEFTAENYAVDAASTPGRIVLKVDASAPTPSRTINGIEVQFTAGYGLFSYDIPAALRQGMKQMIAHLYENRGDGMARALTASGAASLFQPYKVMRL